jgi:hypothetical protein
MTRSSKDFAESAGIRGQCQFELCRFINIYVGDEIYAIQNGDDIC